MLKTCSHCGIVPEDHICPHRKKRKQNKNSVADKFRKGRDWLNKSIEIRERDRYLCRVCEENLYHTITQLNFKKVEVHHIVPLIEDFNQRLENDNLITLCCYHHKMADKGEIPRELLFRLAKHEKINPPRC